MWTLIILNALVFYWEFTQEFDERIFIIYGETPALVMQGKQLYTLMTSMFIHVDLWHIFGNMLYLFIFGDNVEDRLGHAKFLVLYLVFGIAGGLVHSSITVTSGGYEQFIPAVGASGAISGVLGAYIVFYPRARIVSIILSYFFFRLARIPAYIFIGFWFILQILYSGGDSSVAYLAHVGGFLAGFIIAILFRATDRGRRVELY